MREYGGPDLPYALPDDDDPAEVRMMVPRPYRCAAADAYSLSRLPPSSLVKRGSNTKLLVHASVSSLATEPFASPTLPPWDVVIIREKDNPEGKDLLAL